MSTPTPRTVDVEVNADGRIEWTEGQLILPDGSSLSLDAHPPFALMEVQGGYERPSARHKILRVSSIRLLKTANARLSDALRRASSHPALFHRLQEQTAHLLETDESLEALALRLEIACFQDDVEAAQTEFHALLRRAPTDDDTHALEPSLKAGWALLSPLSSTRLSPAEKLTLASNVRVGPWSGPAVPDATRESLRPWVDYVFDRVATGKERAELRRWQARDLRSIEARVERIEDRDEERQGRAVNHARERYFQRGGDPRHDFGPPDEPASPVRRDGDTLPVAWASTIAHMKYGTRNLYLRQAGVRCNSDTLQASRTAVSILAEFAPNLAAKFQQTRALLETPLHVAALLEFSDGSRHTLVAREGMFGSWETHATNEAAFREEHPKARFFQDLQTKNTPAKTEIPRPERPVSAPSTRPARDAAPGDVVPEPGSFVVHPRFGTGEVVGKIPGPAGPKLKIRFDDGEKIVLYKFVTPQ